MDPSCGSGITEKHCKSCDYTFASVEDYTGFGSGFRVCTSGYLWFECRCGSTLMLKKGTYTWFDPVMFLAPASVPVFRDERALQNFPHLPTSLIKLQQSIRNPLSSAKDIAKILRRAPLIAAEILRLSNHLRAGHSEITSIEHAVAWLGRTTISQLTLASALQSYRFKTRFYQLEVFWREAFLTGLIAQTIGQRYSSQKQHDQTYLAGALCNIGKLIGAICYPGKTDEIQQLLCDPNTMTTWTAAEEDLDAVSHVSLGDIAAVIWGLPPEIRRGILYHHRAVERKPRPGSRPELRTWECVGFASLLRHWLSGEPHRIDETQLDSFRVFLGLNDTGIEDLVNSLMPLIGIVDHQIESSEIIN